MAAQKDFKKDGEEKEEELKIKKDEKEVETRRVGEEERRVGEEERRVGEEERRVGEEKRRVGEEERRVGEEERRVGEEERKVGEEERKVSKEERKVGEKEKRVGEEKRRVGEEEKDREKTPVMSPLDDQEYRRTVRSESREEAMERYEDEDGTVVECAGVRRFKTETVEVVKPVLEKLVVDGKVVERRKEVVVAEEVLEEVTEVPHGLEGQEHLQSIVNVKQTNDVLPSGLRTSKKVVKSRVGTTFEHCNI